MFKPSRVTLLVSFALISGAATISQAAAGNEFATARVLPRQAFMQVIDSKSAAGFFRENNGRCQITLMVSDALYHAGDSPPSLAARITLAMEPTQFATVENAEKTSSLKIVCEAGAKSLALETSPSASKTGPDALPATN